MMTFKQHCGGGSFLHSTETLVYRLIVAVNKEDIVFPQKQACIQPIASSAQQSQALAWLWTTAWSSRTLGSYVTLVNRLLFLLLRRILQTLSRLY